METTAKSMSHMKSKTRRKRNHRRITAAFLGRQLWKVIRGVIIVGICYVILYPLFLKLSVSVMDEKDLYDSSVKFIAKHFTWKNYQIAIKGMSYWITLIKTTGLSFLVAFLQLVACLLTAYGFARFQFPGKKILFALVIFSLLLPPQVIMLPMFMHFRYFDVLGLSSALTGKPTNLINTIWPFVIQAVTCMGFKNGLYIYMLRQFFKGMPKELEEAAYIDGSGRLKTFVKIMLPSAVPMMVTVFLFGFVWQWTDSFYTNLYIPAQKVLSNALSSLSAEVYNQYSSFGGTMNFISPGFASMMNNTGVILTIIPLIILYLICQKSFVEGIERSGIVG